MRSLLPALAAAVLIAPGAAVEVCWPAEDTLVLPAGNG